MSVVATDRLAPVARDAAGMTVLDLVRERSFRLELVAGSPERLDRLVCGAQTMDAGGDVELLDRDWIVLVPSARLDGNADAQRDLVADLDVAGAAGLGVCMGAGSGHAPEAMLAEADRRGLPVFTVPRTTPAREIIAFVQRNLVSEEALAFSRMAALQRFLMDALNHDDPRGTIVSRLAEFVEAKAGVLQPSGRFIVATAPDLPARELVECLAIRQHMTVPFETADFHGHAFALGHPERSDVSWLVIAAPRGRRLHPLAKAAGSATVPLLSAIDRLEAAQRDRDCAARQATLEALLDAETPQAARIAAAQLAMWGLDLQAGAAIVAVEDGRVASSASELLHHVRSRQSCVDRPMVCAVRDGRVLVLLPAPVTDELLAAAVPDASLRIGVGRVATDPVDVRRSCSEAVLAIGACPEDGIIGRYDDLDLGTLVLQELQLDRLAPKIDAWLQPLRETPRVLETLVAYFEHNLEVGRTAEALHLHPNSVRYRLARAEEIIGTPVRSPSTMIALHVAIAAGATEPRTPGTV